jgi:protein-S-isoprenylcysteine O-methyltransferase Ste14
MIASLATKLLSIGAYFYFFFGFTAYFFWFAAPDLLSSLPDALVSGVNFLAPSEFNAKPANDTNNIEAALNNVALMLLFIVPHSILANESVKQSMGIPVSVERSLFVLQSQLALHIQMTYWKPFGSTIYDVRGLFLGQALQVFSVAGYLFVLSASFALDHFDLFGLSQAFGVDINKMLNIHPKENGVSKRWHYSIVAHPIMTGFLMECWGAPLMTTSRLLFNVVSTLYCTLGVKLFEEKKLEAMLGKEYDDYLHSVPSFCPFLPPARSNKSKSKSK